MCTIEDKTAVVVVVSYRSVSRNRVRFKALLINYQQTRVSCFLVTGGFLLLEITAGITRTSGTRRYHQIINHIWVLQVLFCLQNNLLNIEFLQEIHNPYAVIFSRNINI